MLDRYIDLIHRDDMRWNACCASQGGNAGCPRAQAGLRAVHEPPWGQPFSGIVAGGRRFGGGHFVAEVRAGH
jgi:hypothetical protein